MDINSLSMKVLVNSPIDDVWKILVNWKSQGEWMLSTKVWVDSEIESGIGVKISALTGVGKFGILDTMEVRKWQPPYLCEVIHTGRIIKGDGTFALTSISASSTEFYWQESIKAPKLLFLLIKPFIWLGVRISLFRFTKFCEKSCETR